MTLTIVDDLSPQSIEELVSIGCGGDREAFERVIEYFYPRLWRYLGQRLRHTEIDPEDAVQETVIKAWRYRDRYDSRYRFSTWIYTIATRTATDMVRANNRFPATESLVTEIAVQSPDPIEENEDAGNVWAQARHFLSSDQYSALWLQYAEELPVAQIAIALSKSNVATRVLLFRARAKLSQVLRESQSNFVAEDSE